MFESLSYLSLQQYWWVIISLLAGFLVFLLFVQGGQTLIYTLGKTEDQKTLIVNALGRKWEFTFTTLVTFGGAFFASFPLFYAVSFGGAYWVWMLILFCFVIQAVAYEFRSKPKNIFGSKTYEVFLFINGAAGTVLLGVAVGTLFNGANFTVNEYNFSKWENSFHGLEAVSNIHNVILGLTVFFLSRVLSILYFIKNINEQNINERLQKNLIKNAIPLIVLFLAFVIILILKKGFAVDPLNKTVFTENYKYLHNLLQMPLIFILFVIGIAGILSGIVLTFLNKSFQSGFLLSGAGTVLTVFCLFIILGFNHTAYYPSLADLQSSLTIENSSSSKFTLTAMSYVSLLVPFVLAYIIYAWRSVNNKKIDMEELKNESHVY